MSTDPDLHLETALEEINKASIRYLAQMGDELENIYHWSSALIMAGSVIQSRLRRLRDALDGSGPAGLEVEMNLLALETPVEDAKRLHEYGALFRLGEETDGGVHAG